MNANLVTSFAVLGLLATLVMAVILNRRFSQEHARQLQHRLELARRIVLSYGARTGQEYYLFRCNGQPILYGVAKKVYPPDVVDRTISGYFCTELEAWEHAMTYIEANLQPGEWT